MQGPKVRSNLRGGPKHDGVHIEAELLPGFVEMVGVNVMLRLQSICRTPTISTGYVSRLRSVSRTEAAVFTVMVCR